MMGPPNMSGSVMSTTRGCRVMVVGRLPNRPLTSTLRSLCGGGDRRCAGEMLDCMEACNDVRAS